MVTIQSNGTEITNDNEIFQITVQSNGIELTSHHKPPEGFQEPMSLSNENHIHQYYYILTYLDLFQNHLSI